MIRQEQVLVARSRRVSVLRKARQETDTNVAANIGISLVANIGRYEKMYART